MNYSQSINYIDSLAGLGSVPGLERIKELLKRLDNPQNKLKVIHVAGTNGKGSICAFLEYGLRECGLIVGRYISPTLFSYLERFQVGGNEMSEEEFASILSVVKEKCDEMVDDGFDQPTAFEIETAIAFMFALRCNVDVFILECGMGGTEDATNVVSSPVATVFASISLDHMQFLGNTVSEIAKSKSGIMRENVPVIVSTSTDKTVYQILLSEAQNRGVKPVIFSENYISELKDVHHIRKPLDGEYQWENMATAYATYRAITKPENLREDIFFRGLEKTKWPGRFEKVCDDPIIIRDGAHNIDAVKRLTEEIEKQYPNGAHLIMGVYKDKEYDDMLKLILLHALSFTTVTAPNPLRALDGKILADKVRSASDDMGLSLDVQYENSMKAAIDRAVNLAKINQKNSEPIIVFGSLSLAAEVENEVLRS